MEKALKESLESYKKENEQNKTVNNTEEESKYFQGQ